MEEQNKEQQADQETKKPSKKIKRKIAFVIITILLVFAGFYLVKEMQYESTDDAYVETTTVNVAPKVSGEILEVYVTDNQKVNAGDLVAIIDDADYKVKLAQANANYEKIKFDQANAKANLKASESNIELAKKIWKDIQICMNRGLFQNKL